ncbi:MAG: dTDP-glucose 4,6-dehydratase [Gemmatimonadetes bacterium]|nr:dTDP-glucose 4,6-dehydratase [Gemmatimonadota bacterium]
MTETQLVTGGAGFIGSNYIRSILSTTSDQILIVDKLTYAGNLATIQDVGGDPRVQFFEADIVDAGQMRRLFEIHRPRVAVNFAAESHVDRSIDGPRNFVQSNTVGVFELLEAASRYWVKLSGIQRDRFRYLQVSTDEVIGSLGEEGHFSEESHYQPRSPYSATKASADHLVRAYNETYQLPTIITNCTNNYGPYQYPEKLIPVATLNALAGKEIPVYGDGTHVRDWIHVDDHCRAITGVLRLGRPGSTYAIGARNELTNLEVVEAVCDVLEEVVPAADNPELAAVRSEGSPTKGASPNYRDLITFVEDRPGHDRRYAMDPSKIESEIGWSPQRTFEEGLKETVKWYVENQKWCAEVRGGPFKEDRLGLGPTR